MVTERRRFLQRTVAATGGLLFCGCDLFGARAIAAHVQSQSGTGRRPVVIGGRKVRTIDMHSHVYVHDVWPLIKERNEAAAKSLTDMVTGPLALDVKTVAGRLRDMDHQGIDVHVVSLHPGQYHYWAAPDLAAQIVKIQNEKLAELCAAHPDRFVAFGAVSIQHPELAAEQMDDGVKTLGMRGFTIGGSVNGDEIADPKFDPFWRKAEELGVVIFTHPATFAEGRKRFAGGGYLTNIVGNPLETAVALSHMIFDGLLDRFPNVRILSAHGGGYLPSYIGRSDNCHSWNPDCQKMKRKPSEYLKGPQLYFDSLLYNPENIRHLVATVGASQVVVGTDYPFDIASTTPVDDILKTPGLTPDEQIAILGGNATRLLKLKSP